MRRYNVNQLPSGNDEIIDAEIIDEVPMFIHMEPSPFEKMTRQIITFVVVLGILFIVLQTASIVAKVKDIIPPASTPSWTNVDP